MRKIRVLHCLETVGSGGVEQRRLSLVKNLNTDFYDQHLLCTQAIGGIPQQIINAGCSISEVGVHRQVFDLKSYGNALKVVKDFKPDVIHGAVFEGVSMASICGRIGRVPIIIGEETSDPQNRSWKGSLLYRGVISLTHHMVAVSPAVESYLTNNIYYPASRVSMITNGVAQKASPDESYINKLRDELGFRNSDFVIGTVGRLLDHHKRVSDLLVCLSCVIKSVPNAKLLIVGAGPDEGKLRALVNEMQLTDKVFFVGYQPDPQPYYSLMDIFALASAYEAFGLVLVEAMYNKLPIVATRTGGIPKVVLEGETAFLSSTYDPHGMAHNIIKLFRNPELMTSFGDKALARAIADFSEDRYVSDVDALYRGLLSERGII
ncbi:glycosyltransferase family 4 protein [Alcanivorax sp. NBRC 102028]|uniref:glycosyltransferase family 4 protein n=1 Tax=Alcanivorax sp. NBRC 102028 TaxID=1113897 RepID=UPI000A9F5A5B|nr:glycosyltransferase family 4 protein [Alcanivorax sp. NBRC 102028]